MITGEEWRGSIGKKNLNSKERKKCYGSIMKIIYTVL